MIIDGHCHWTDAARPAGTGGGGTAFSRYWARADAACIGHTLLFPYFSTDYQRTNRLLGAFVRSYSGRFSGLAMVHAVRDRGRIETVVREAVLADGLRGLKVHRRDAPLSREICRVARRFSLPVVYDPMGQVGEVCRLVEEFEDVAFIMPHLGSFADDELAQRQVIALMKMHDNLYADTSAVRHFDLLKTVLDSVGARRVLFGSDGPWLHPAVELEKIYQLELPREEEALVLKGNVLRLFGRC